MNENIVFQKELNGEYCIYDLKFLNQNKEIILATSEGKILINFKIKEKNNLKEKVIINAHKGPIWRIDISDFRLGTYLGSCGLDGYIRIWMEVNKNWQLIFENNELNGSVNDVKWSPWELNGKLCAVSSSGLISIIQKNNNEWIVKNIWKGHEKGINCISWANSTTIENFINNCNKPPRDMFATAGNDNLIKIWSFDKIKNEYYNFKLIDNIHTNWIRDICWNKQVFNNIDLITSIGEDKKIFIHKLEKNNVISKIIYENDSNLWRCKFNLSGTLLGVSITNKEEKNEMLVFKENENKNWVLINKKN